LSSLPNAARPPSETAPPRGRAALRRVRTAYAPGGARLALEATVVRALAARVQAARAAARVV
jgi:hypothetical protein